MDYYGILPPFESFEFGYGLAITLECSWVEILSCAIFINTD
jgi:hypothetical protein